MLVGAGCSRGFVVVVKQKVRGEWGGGKGGWAVAWTIGSFKDCGRGQWLLSAIGDWGSHGAGGMGEKGGKGEGTYPAGGLMDGGQQQLVSVVRFLGMVKKKVRGRESEQKCL